MKKVQAHAPHLTKRAGRECHSFVRGLGVPAPGL